MSHYVIRNYRPSDFKDYVQLHVEAERLEPIGRYISPQVLGYSLGQPNSSPEKDLFIAEIAGTVVGYVNIRPELGIGRVVLDGLVHPEHRRRGLAPQLFHKAVHRALGLGARLAHVKISEGNVAAKALLSRLGFRFIRRFLGLKLELSELHPPSTEHLGLSCRYLRRGEEDKLTEIQNRAFAGTWGYNPNTTEEIAYRLSYCSPEDVILVCQGDVPIGFCWTRVNLEQHAATGPSKGIIYMLGVDPHYRGKGVGRCALLAGLSYLKSRGMEVAELTVDGENKVAHALYESVGFSIWSISEWYEKALDQPTRTA